MGKSGAEENIVATVGIQSHGGKAELLARGADSRCCTGTRYSPLYVVTLAQGSTGGKDCGQDEEAGH